MRQEALKLALDALETELSIDWTNNDEFDAAAKKMYEAIAAIKEALAQPEQEPVKIVQYNCTCGRTMKFESVHGVVAPQRTEQEPVAWQLWVGADTPLNDPMGWQFYSTYDSKKSAEISARTINIYQQAPFAKLVPLYTAPPQRHLESTTDMMMELADRLGELPDDVDPRAWSHLLVYAPQRQPLTDAEIADIVIEMNGNEPTGLFWRDLARAIEAAHGVGDKK